MASIDISASGGGTSVAPTLISGTTDGTLQVTKADGTFGTVLLGAAGATTGIKLVASNGSLAVVTGAGVAASLSAAVGTFTGAFTSNSAGTTNQGVLLGNGGATTTLRVDYTGTAAVYYLRDNNGVGVGAAILQGTYTVPKATNFSPTAGDSGTHYNVTAAATCTLPTPALGLTYRFTNVAATALAVTTPSGVINGTGLTGAATRSTSAAFATVDLVCNDGANWIMRGTTGTWT